MSELLTPVVFIIFNRPDTTWRVLNRISAAKPRCLYVLADGPRLGHPEDIQNCQGTRSVIDSIDWECEIFKNYSEQNLGCKKRVYTGLNWVFERVESAIILEDDCLPDISFFRFCEELLVKYRDDERVSVISGNNFQFDHHRTNDSYYFSRYPHCWGWATWRRAWQHCDIEMADWPTVRDQGLLHDILSRDRAAVGYWSRKFQQTYTGKINTWDYPWLLTCWLQGGLSILPNNNLVSNIGFKPGGTHHSNGNTPFADMATIPMEFPLVHPKFPVRHAQADAFTQLYQFSTIAQVWRRLMSILGFRCLR
ncbi:MAG: glycosyltransferase family 2 protein [Cyanobacteria bacterium P01_D01_bin.105]